MGLEGKKADGLAPESSSLALEQRIAGCDQLDQLFDIFAAELAPLLPVSDRVSVAFLEPDGEWLRIYRLLPPVDAPRDKLPRVRVEGTPVGQVVRDGVGRVVQDVRADPNITFGHASHDAIRSTISVPVRIGGQVVGAMNAGSRTIGACNAQMLLRLAEVASFVAPAIYSAEQALLHPAEVPTVEDWPTLEEHQRRYVLRVLEHRAGVIEGAAGAARLLGLRPSTLRSLMKRLSVSAQPMRGKGRSS